MQGTKGIKTLPRPLSYVEKHGTCIKIIPTRFDPQGTIIKRSNQSSAA